MISLLLIAVQINRLQEGSFVDLRLDHEVEGFSQISVGKHGQEVTKKGIDRESECVCGRDREAQWAGFACEAPKCHGLSDFSSFRLSLPCTPSQKKMEEAEKTRAYLGEVIVMVVGAGGGDRVDLSVSVAYVLRKRGAHHLSV